MRVYFALLFVLFLVLIYVSYEISTSFHSYASEPQAPESNLARDDNGTSACFEKRYSPQIRQCGGLLKYGYPRADYASYESSTQRPSSKGKGIRSKRHLAGNERQGRTGFRHARALRPSTPQHSAVATFEPTW